MADLIEHVHLFGNYSIIWWSFWNKQWYKILPITVSTSIRCLHQAFDWLTSLTICSHSVGLRDLEFTARRPHTTLRRILVHYKDKRSMDETSGLVLWDTTQQTWEGETARLFGTRKREQEVVVEVIQSHYAWANRKISDCTINWPSPIMSPNSLWPRFFGRVKDYYPEMCEYHLWHW